MTAVSMDAASPLAMPPPNPLAYMTAGLAPETVSLLSGMSETERKKCADTVVKEFNQDWKSSERYREKRAQILKLFLGILPDEEDDGGNRAKIHYPIIATAVQRIHARIYDQQFPSNGEFFGVHPTDAMDLERCIRVAKHLNWQIAHKMPEYVPEHDVNIMIWLLYGSAFTYTYWNTSKNRPCVESCRTEDIVLPYAKTSRDPSLADVPRITRIRRLTRREIENEAESGYYDAAAVASIFKDVDAGQTGGNISQDDKTTGSVQAVIDQAQGVDSEEMQTDPDAPRRILEQHRWYRLPNEKKDRAVIVEVDELTRTLLSVRLREDEDPEDRARYNREKKEREIAYENAMTMFEQSMAQYMAASNPYPDPMMDPATEDDTGMPLEGVTTSTNPMVPPVMPAPTAPAAPADPEPPKMVPIHFFTHYICEPNPEGVYGLGIGFMLEGHNMAADTMMSQFIDAATLSNTQTGIYSRQAKLGRGEFRIRPGHMNQTDLSPQDVTKGISFLKFAPPEPALAQAADRQDEKAQELSGANEILSGEVGGSNETATTTQIRISQALAAITIQNKRYTRARTIEGQKLARLNSVHLPDSEYFAVVDPMKQLPGGAPMVAEMQVGRMDYLEDVDITVTADPRMASQPQRFQEAVQALQLAQSVQVAAMNPILMNALLKNVFVAMDRPELVAAISAMPMMPQPGMGGPMPPGAGPPGPGAPVEPGPTVPNAGPTPANGVQMSQGV